MRMNALVKFLLLKQVQIYMSLVDFLQGIPIYAKYVKEIVENKRRMTNTRQFHLLNRVALGFRIGFP